MDYRQITPEFTDENGEQYKGLVKTKESCITDKNGIRLDHKLDKLMSDIGNTDLLPSSIIEFIIQLNDKVNFLEEIINNKTT